MSSERYVVLGLGLPRAPWFRSVAHWATAGSLAIEFVKCLSMEDLAARLGSARTFSALLVDAGLPGLDRDAIDKARASGCAVIVVADGRHAWPDADAVLPASFDQRALLDALRGHSAMVVNTDHAPADPVPRPPAWRGRVAALCGPGGTGASTAAIALTQAMAADPRNRDLVVLADLARPGEQAMLHDAREVVPGIEELVDLHRSATPSASDVRNHTFAVDGRGYALLLGLRRARAWSGLRPRAVEAAIAGLARAFRVVVCDCTGDLEGEADGGSADVEDRNALARTAVTAADVVFAVGAPGVKGVHSLARIMGDLLGAGVEGARIVPVVNRAPRSGRARAEIARALAELTPARRQGLAAPVFLPERRIDDALRDGARLPAGLGAPLVAAFEEIATALGPPDADEREPELLVPGSLGHWDDDAEAVG